jgi:shikimate dehydrogenase
MRRRKAAKPLPTASADARVESRPPIDGATRLLALIADPVAQARSPGLVNQALAARRQLGRTVLVPLHIDAAGLEASVAALRHVRNFAGAIVSMPHKVAISPLLDELIPVAARVGAVNVLRREASGRLIGTILDGEGFVEGLTRAGHVVAGTRCLLAGAGGAAAAIAFALADHGIGALTVVNRNPDRALALVERVRRYRPDLEIAAVLPANAGFDIAINATPLGMRAADPLPLPEPVIANCALVAECVLAPETTALLRVARARGCAVHGGLAMLAAQIEPMLDFFGVN